MEKQIVYVPIEIKSQEDLPKDQILHVGLKSGFEELIYIEGKEIKKPWKFDDDDKPIVKMENIDWYLQPVEMPTEEEMKKAAEEFEQESSCGFSAKGLISDEFYQGAKWFKDKLK